VEQGEQCDDGAGGSATCSSTCMMITASACLTCETTVTTANPQVCIGTTISSSSHVVGCAGLMTADAQANCRMLLACLQTHPNCSNPANVSPPTTDPTPCFCGALDTASCSGAQAASIAGPCAASYFAIYGGVSNTNRDFILGDFFARATATGMANNLYACDVTNNCQSQCP
jgi:hypothetical protein